MKKFIITIEETINQEFEVVAETSKEASEIAIRNYKSGIFVLDNPSICNKQMSVSENDNEEISNWMEF